MISIVSSKLERCHLNQLREWFVSEWGSVDPFEGTADGFVVPAPLLVVEGKKLLGGLAFTSSSMPESKELGLWVNALFIVEEYRGKGLASKLIEKARDAADNIEINEIFVYTGVPVLYQKLGWKVVTGSNNNDENSVLKSETKV